MTIARRRSLTQPMAAVLAMGLLCGCMKDSSVPAEPTAVPPPAEAPGHGDAVDLGRLTVAAHEFQLVAMGEVAPGKESAFEVHGVDIASAELAKLNLYLWVEAQDGTQLSAPAKGDRESEGLHFHVTPRAGKGDPHRVVLRLRAGDVDERAGLPLSGHGHEHEGDGPHHGLVASFGGASTTGFLELKLHDDEGDLELWLAQDEAITRPLDLPLDTEVEVEFVDVKGRKVILRARNRDKNEDEDGNPNNRGGQTNYFIYPSQDGDDASWLQGKEFSSIVMVRFASGTERLESEEFVLKPHVH